MELKLPDLGESIESADVLEVLVSEGDTITKDQPIIDAETDKASVQIPAEVAGKVTAVHVKQGQTIKVGQLMLTVEESAEPSAGKQESSSKQPARPEPREEESAEQQPAKKNAEQEKAAPEVDEGEQREVARAPRPQAPSPTARQAPIAAAPSVRQFAREIGIDIQDVTGTGPGRRITIDDVKLHARSRRLAPNAKDAPRVSREAMSKVRKVTAAHMAKCWEEIPHVTLHDEADVTSLEALRQRYKRRAEEAGGKLTITAIFLKILAAGLKSHPRLNARIDMEASEIEYRHEYNIGVAVDTPKGLLVPVVRDVDKKSIIDLAVELNDLGEKARAGKLQPDEMRGGTFTLTNLGSIGVGNFTPIINHPEVAIMGMGRTRQQPVWKGDEFTPRLVVPLSLSIDHRLIDGADGARFLRWIVEAVNNPLLLTLE